MGSLSILVEQSSKTWGLLSMYTVKDNGSKHSTYGICTATNSGQYYLKTCHVHSNWLFLNSLAVFELVVALVCVPKNSGDKILKNYSYKEKL